MIYPQSNIQLYYLDLNNGEHGFITIPDLLSKYYHSVNIQEKNQFFFGSDVIIRSWNGWTKLRAIKKIPVDLTKKYYLLHHRNAIILSEDHMLPAYSKYDIDNPTIGFHGYTDYNYTSMELSRYLQSTSKCEFLRFYRSPTEHGFIRPYIEDFDHITEGTNCYEVITESKFFNLNDFYLF